MKQLLNYFLLISFSVGYAQLHISSGTEFYVAGEAAVYSNESIINQGILTFKPAMAVNFTVDAGLDNSAGTINFNEATFVIGSGTDNANSSDVFVFNANDQVKYVILDKNSGTTTVTNGNLGISETLELRSGTLTAGDKVTLLNPSTDQEAYVVVSTGGAANLSVQKFYPANRAVRMVASPVNGGSIFDNWQNGGDNNAGFGMHITGGAASDGFDQSDNNNPSMFELISGTGWQPISNTNATNLEVGVPYRLLVRGDRSIDLNSEDAESATTLMATGDLVVGSVNYMFPSVTSGDYNLAFATNPYQCRIDVSEVLNSNANTDNTRFWVWDPTINSRGAFVIIDQLTEGDGITTPANTTATKFIEPSQAFFIQTTEENPVITFNENIKNITTGLNRSNADLNEQTQLLLNLQDANMQIVDAVRFRFSAVGDNSPDALDAPKLDNLDENLASVNQNNLFSIESRMLPAQDDVIPLFTNNWRNQEYSFKAELTGLENTPVYLIDTYLNTQTLLENEQSYSFTVDQNIPGSVDSNRFYLSFDAQSLTIADSVLKSIKLYPNPVKDELIIDIPMQTNIRAVRLINVLGQVVHTASQPTLKLNHLKSGLYTVEIETDQGRYIQKVIKQ
jgi:hypothetical protein